MNLELLLQELEIWAVLHLLMYMSATATLETVQVVSHCLLMGQVLCTKFSSYRTWKSLPSVSALISGLLCWKPLTSEWSILAVPNCTWWIERRWVRYLQTTLTFHQFRLVDLYTRVSTIESLGKILNLFTNLNSTLRFVITTTACGMDFDCQDIHTIIHWEVHWTECSGDGQGLETSFYNSK